MEWGHVIDHGSWRRVTAAGVLVLATAVGCGRAVGVDPVPGAPAAECARLTSALPRDLGGEPGIAVTPDDGTTAAWGSPPIVWRCGVPRPSTLGPTSQLLTVNGVQWYPEELSDGSRFTSMGGPPHTEVSVPSAYPNPAGYLTQLPVALTAGPTRESASP